MNQLLQRFQSHLIQQFQIEYISTQMQDMKPNQWNKEIHKVHVEERQWNDCTQQNLDNTTQPCSYCGLEKAHPKGRNCPAYGIQCEICKKYDHFTAVCRFNGRKQVEERESTRRHQDEQMKPWRINTADGKYSESDTSSDEEFLEKSIGHLKVKTVKKSNSVREVPSIQINLLHERVTELEKALASAKDVIQNLVSRFHPFTQKDHKIKTFQEGSVVSDTNEEGKLRDLKTDIDIFDGRNRITPKTALHSDTEESEMENQNQHLNVRIQNDEKQSRDHKKRRSSRRKKKRH